MLIYIISYFFYIDGVHTCLLYTSPAEDGPDVGGIHDALQHRDAAGVSAQCLDAARLRTAHGAEHTPGQRVAGQGLQHTAVRRCV